MTTTNIFMGSVLLLDEFNFPHGLESMLELTLGQVVGGAAKSCLRRSGGQAHTQGQTWGGVVRQTQEGIFWFPVSGGLGTPG